MSWWDLDRWYGKEGTSRESVLEWGFYFLWLLNKCHCLVVGFVILYISFLFFTREEVHFPVVLSFFLSLYIYIYFFFFGKLFPQSQLLLLMLLMNFLIFIICCNNTLVFKKFFREESILNSENCLDNSSNSFQGASSSNNFVYLITIAAVAFLHHLSIQDNMFNLKTVTLICQW
jgi:hypothetical protein